MLKKANLDDFDGSEDVTIYLESLNLTDKQYRKLMYYLQILADEIYQTAFEEGQENG